MTTISVAAIALLFCHIPAIAQDSGDRSRGNSSQCSTAYENLNQIDYGPLRVSEVTGRSVIQIETKIVQNDVRDACLVLFTEKDHRVVASIRTAPDGRFIMKSIAPGRYRLVARIPGFCVANIPLEVVRPNHPSVHPTEILIRFLPRGLDACSYGELASTKTD